MLVVRVPILFLAMALVVRKRPAADNATSDSLALRERAAGDSLGRALSNCGTKVGLCNALSILQEYGIIDSNEFLSRGTVKKQLAAAQREHADANTQYGRVQKMPETAATG